MTEIDTFSNKLLDEAKWFFEEAKTKDNSARDRYLHASILLGFAGLESQLNSIANDFADRKEFSILEKSLMLQRDFSFEKGEFTLKDKLKMSRIDQRIEFLYRFFSGVPVDPSVQWYSSLKQGIDIRNKLTHPKENIHFSIKQIEGILQAIIETLDVLYKVIYKKTYPKASLGLKSTL